MYNSIESPQCVGYRKVVLIQSEPFKVKEVTDNDGKEKTVHENTDNSDEQA